MRKSGSETLLAALCCAALFLLPTVVTGSEAAPRKEIVFEMVKTVHVYVTMAASGSGIVFHQNYKFLQGGGKRYRVHQTNGARVLPGTYDLRLPDRLTPYVRLLGG